jgi:UDP-glucuronate decarboxylase
MASLAAKKRILVTGASGFVGSHVVQQFTRQGHDVFAIVRKNRLFEPDTGLAARVRSIGLDLRRSDDLRAAVREVRPELAIHLAWYTAPGKYWSAPQNLDWVTVSLEFAGALAAVGCTKLVAAGSCAEYDWSHNVLSEASTPLKPRTLYGSCKNATREILAAYCNSVSMEFAWTRLFFMYGPGEARERLVPSVILSLLRGENAKCSAGEQARDFLYVGDAASGIASVALGSGTGAFNIASGRPIRIRAIVETIARMMGSDSRVDFGAIAANPTEPQWLAGDIHKLTSIADWRPSISIEEGLAQTVKWWTAKSALMSVEACEALHA